MGGLPWSFWLEKDPVRKIQYLSIIIGVTKWKDDVLFEPAMLIDHTTYHPPPLFDVKPGPPRSTNPATYVEYQNGDGVRWRYRNLILPLGEGLETVYEDHIEINEEGSTKGRAWFTGPVVFPALTEVSGGGEETWMSITPMEIFTCREGVRYAAREARARGRPASFGPAKKKVLIAGLGLGWILQQVAALDDVREIVVVEKSRGLCDWYGASMCANIPKVKELIVSDYWDVAAEYPDHVHLIDIWPHLGESYDDDHLKTAAFRRSRLSFWAWGYQFGEDEEHGAVLDEDEAVTRQLGFDEDEDDEDDETEWGG